MNDKDSRNEDMFRDALKELVLNEPEKLEFFDGIDANATVPAFVPAESNAPVSISIKRKRRQYAYSMAAIAACFVLFISISVVGMPSMPFGGASSEDMQYSLEMAADTGAGEPAMEEQAAATVPEAPAMAPAAPADEPEAAPAPADDSPADEALIAADSVRESGLDENAAIDTEEQEILADVGIGSEKAVSDTDSGSIAPDSTNTSQYQDAPKGINIALIVAIVCAIVFVILMIRYRKLR